MNVLDLQKAIGTAIDGKWGPASKAALMAQFTNPEANRISAADIEATADRLDCSVLQLNAVRSAEANGSGFDGAGRPKILFERHKFHKFTGGNFSPAPFSMSAFGGYEVSSWTKLCDAIGTGAVDAAFMACSWGAFQVLCEYWSDLGYPSPYALAWTCAQSEGDQLELLARYIEHFGLRDELQALTSNPATCRAFAAAYNGPAYRRNRYDQKLAEAMAA